MSTTSTVLPPRPICDRRRRALSSAALAVVALSAASLLGGCSTGDAAARAAATQVGRPYRYGGAGPSGFDCSGLTMWAWHLAGKQLPRTAAQQYAATTPVSAREIQPGDLAFYSNGGRISHVAMYIGRGTLVQARNSRYPVERKPVGWWGDHLVGYRRVR